MKIGDIKIEALKLMFTTYEVDYSIDDLPDLKSDDSVKSYLFAMPGAINRAFDRLRDMDLLKEKSVTITPTEGDVYATFELTTITDLYKISRIAYIDSYNEYEPSIEWKTEGDTLLLFRLGGEYHLIYYVELPIITSTTEETTEIDLPNELLRLIPYYIKGELYEEDQPELAAEAMAIFEQRIFRYTNKPTSNQTHIQEVFKI